MVKLKVSDFNIITLKPYVTNFNQGQYKLGHSEEMAFIDRDDPFQNYSDHSIIMWSDEEISI